MTTLTVRAVRIYLATLLLALGAFAFDVRTDHDENVDFSAYRTYRWVAGTPVDMPMVQQRIETALRAELAAKGLTEDTEAPDVWVVAHAAAGERKEVDFYGFGYGYRWSAWGPTSVKIRSVDGGMLVVDLVDAQAKELVWRGIAVDTISPKPNKNQKAVQKAAAKMFKQFPPGQ